MNKYKEEFFKFMENEFENLDSENRFSKRPNFEFLWQWIEKKKREWEQMVLTDFFKASRELEQRSCKHRNIRFSLGEHTCDDCRKTLSGEELEKMVKSWLNRHD